MSTRIEPNDTNITRTATLQQMQDRKRLLIEERTQHTRTTEAKPGDPNTYTTGDDKAAFFTLAGLAYYERLTGHIEELDYMIAALQPGRQS